MRLRSPLSGLPRGRWGMAVGTAFLCLAGLIGYVDGLAWHRYEHPLGPGYDSPLPVAILDVCLTLQLTVVGVVTIVRARRPGR